MTNLLDYKILKSLNLYEIEAKVKEYSKKGWKPFGGPFVDADENYCQAMILIEEFV